tara:strand:- start:544 stop:1857 length:1314 start_codon:yes stop_codon:yes gene_type:complete
MSKDAYIAGKNTPLGASTPTVFKSDSEKKSFQAAQDEKAYVEKAKGNPTNDPNVDNYTFQTESYQNAPSPEAVAEVTGKDPYKTGADTSKGIYTIKPEKETPDWMTPSWALNVGIAGAKGIQVLLDKIFKPSVEDFNDPVVLAAINRLFEEKEKEGDTNFKTNYLKKYEDKMKEAFDPQLQFEDEQGFGLTGDATGIASLFDNKLADAAAAAQSGELGKGVQRINFPEEYYEGVKEKTGLPQTIGELEDLAKLDATKYPGTDLAQMIFDARAELDRQQGGQGGGGAGIPSLPQFQDKMDITKPGYTGDPKNPFGLPGDYGSGFIGSQFYKPGTSGLAVMTPVKLPDGTTHMFPDSSSANQFQQYLDHLAMNKMGPSTGIPQAVETSTGIPSLTPTTINYASMAPQFGSQYPGYINQGVMNPNIFPYYDNLRKYYGVG